MQIHISPDAEAMGRAAATAGAKIIREALAVRNEIAIIVATGSSQFEVLNALTAEPDIDWSRVTGFHLDEYIGLPMSHPASFRGYLRDRFVEKVPLKAFHYIDAETDPEGECQRVGDALAGHTVAVAFIGIGENAHIAFNDPPADFDTTEPYLIVELDEACRRQQLGEGWFPTLDDVPTRAISMSVRKILESERIICSVPDQRKAAAVAAAVTGPITPEVPASILQDHPATELFLDDAAATELPPEHR